MITNQDDRYGACNWVTVAQKAGAWVQGTDRSQFPVRGAGVIGKKATGSGALEILTGQHAWTVTESNGSNRTKSADGGSFQAHVYADAQRWEYRNGNWYATDRMTTRKVFGWSLPDKLPWGDTGEVQPDAEPSTTYQEQGSDAAKDAAKDAEEAAGKDERKKPTAEDFLRAQKRMENATNEAINRIKATPPLKMLVNPTSFKPSSEKIVSDSNRSRSHHIIEHWGEQQEKIDGSGKLLGFYTQDQNGPGPGITRTARHYSVSYQNFMSLFLLYKSNGGVWLQDFFETRADKDAMNLSALGSIYIYYDNILYIGSFDSLNTSEADTAPYTLEYTFSFIVRASFLLDRQLENTAQNYGAAGLFAQSLGTTDVDKLLGDQPQTPYTLEQMEAQHQEVVDEWASEDRSDAQKKTADDLFAPPAPPEPSGGNAAIGQGKGGKSKNTNPKAR